MLAIPHRLGSRPDPLRALHSRLSAERSRRSARRRRQTTKQALAHRRLRARAPVARARVQAVRRSRRALRARQGSRRHRSRAHRARKKPKKRRRRSRPISSSSSWISWLKPAPIPSSPPPRPVCDPSRAARPGHEGRAGGKDRFCTAARQVGSRYQFQVKYWDADHGAFRYSTTPGVAVDCQMLGATVQKTMGRSPPRVARPRSAGVVISVARFPDSPRS